MAFWVGRPSDASAADEPDGPAAKGTPEAETLEEAAVLGRLLGLGVEQHTESEALGVEPVRESAPDLLLRGPLATEWPQQNHQQK